jgi:hypothetical protein
MARFEIILRSLYHTSLQTIGELEEELYQEMTQKEKLLDMKALLDKEIEKLRSYFAPPPGF